VSARKAKPTKPSRTSRIDEIARRLERVEKRDVYTYRYLASDVIEPPWYYDGRKSGPHNLIRDIRALARA